MPQPWTVPGYAPLEPLAGATDPGRPGLLGSRRARRLADDAVVLVRVVPGDADTVQRLRDDAAVLGALGHPHLVPIRDVVLIRDVVPVRDLLPAGDAVAVVTDVVPGSPLGDLLERVGGLTAGEVVTLLAPLADAVAAMHARGVTHGAIGVETVLVTADGRPLLDGGPAMTDDGPADDVRSLAVLGRRALGEAADLPGALQGVLRRVERCLPGDRMAAADLAAELLRACPARPLPVDAGPVGRPEPTGGGRSGRRAPAVRLRAVGAAVAGLVLAVAVGTAWGNADDRSAASARPRSPAPLDAATGPPTDAAVAPSTPVAASSWRAVVGGLERRRTAAIRHRDIAVLRRVYLPACAAGRRDRRLVRGLLAQRRRVHGLRPVVLAAVVLDESVRRVDLRITDTLSAVRVVAADGHVVRRRAGRGAATMRLTLRGGAAGWRIARVAQPMRAVRAASTSS